MKHTVTVSLKKENLDAAFIREILLSGSCEAILPMNLYRGKKYCFGGLSLLRAVRSIYR